LSEKAKTMNLQNKIVLITGGARMGTVVGRALGSRGAHIIFSYRSSRASAQEAALALHNEGISTSVLRCDVTRSIDVTQLAKTIQGKHGRLDVVIHMASIYGSQDILDAKTAAAWEANFHAHANSAFYLCRAFAPIMKKSGAGRFVFITDWTVASGRPRYKGFTPYYASKMALKGLVEAMALELAPEIQVNAIAPGPILPPPGLSRKELKAVEQSTPLNRWGGPEEIAKAVVFLTETDFVTGETIRVDGGRHLY
jgi:NAD(P)-dependent dehydrogenase (short-subunit alcohol dehydrogenase family)